MFFEAQVLPVGRAVEIKGTQALCQARVAFTQQRIGPGRLR